MDVAAARPAGRWLERSSPAAYRRVLIWVAALSLAYYATAGGGLRPPHDADAAEHGRALAAQRPALRRVSPDALPRLARHRPVRIPHAAGGCGDDVDSVRAIDRDVHREPVATDHRGEHPPPSRSSRADARHAQGRDGLRAGCRRRCAGDRVPHFGGDAQRYGLVLDFWMLWRMRFVTNVLSTIVLAPPLMTVLGWRSWPRPLGPPIAEFLILLTCPDGDRAARQHARHARDDIPLALRAAPVPLVGCRALRPGRAGHRLVLHDTLSLLRQRASRARGSRHHPTRSSRPN